MLDESVKRRIRELIEKKQWDYKRTSREAGLNDAYVSQLLDRRSSPSMSSLTKLATALGVSIEYLLTGRAEPSTPISQPSNGNYPNGAPKIVRVPVRGRAYAGAWMEVEDDCVEYDEVTAVATDLAGPQFAYQVQGPSMNRKRIFDGDYVVCVDLWSQNGRLPQTGDIVVVERRDGRRTDRSVKELVVRQDRYELWPRSDHPAWQEPIIVDPKEWREDEGISVEIVGLVIAVTFFPSRH